MKNKTPVSFSKYGLRVVGGRLAFVDGDAVNFAKMSKRRVCYFIHECMASATDGTEDSETLIQMEDELNRIVNIYRKTG